MPSIDRTEGYQPTLTQPWIIEGRPGCIRVDYESSRESLFWVLLLVGLGMCFFGSYGFEPKRYHYRNPLHSEMKLLLFIGSIMGFVFSTWLRGKRIALQIGAAILATVPFGLALNLYLTHGWSAVPQEYFFPTLVMIGFNLAAVSALQLLSIDDYLVIDPRRGGVFDHTQFLFTSRETPLCQIDKVAKVQVIERKSTHKGVTSVFLTVGLELPLGKSFKCLNEVSIGTTEAPSFGTEAGQVIALANAIGKTCGKGVIFPPSVPRRMRLHA